MAGFVLHVLGSMYQLINVTLPSEERYFRGHDDPTLEVGVKMVLALLAVNTIVAVLVAVSL